MSQNPLPQRLWRPLAEVKNFLEKMPSGVKLPQISQKVKTFAALNKKDKDVLIRYLDERESIVVLQARKLDSNYLTTFFFHKKYEIPDQIDGYAWFAKRMKSHLIVTNESYEPEAEPLETEKANEVSSVAPQPDPEPQPIAEPVKESDVVLDDAVIAEDAAETINAVNCPNDLRKRALEMLMEADQADQGRITKLLNDEVKPKIESFVERLNAANDAVQSTLDALYDQMGEVDKIAIEFKKFASSLCD